MSLLSNLFGKKKKKPSASCDISGTLLEYGEGYAISSAQLISSQPFWDYVMLQPETKSYTISHFEKSDPSAKQMRAMIFKKYSSKNAPWIICDDMIKMFDIDKDEARDHAQKWWEAEKNYKMETCGDASQQLDENKYQEFMTYAVMDAGKSAVA